MKTINLKFENKSGQKLAAKLELPLAKKPRAFGILAHCFTCSKNLTAIKNISRSLSEQDFAILRFDFTGLGESEGEFTETNFSTNIEDLVAAADYLNENYESPRILIGHSLGGTAVIRAATEIKSTEAIAVIGAPADPPHVIKLFQGSQDEIEKTGEATVSIGGRPFKITKQFLDDLQSKSNQDILKELKKPLLILHSPHDKIVDISNASEIYKAAYHPKSFISLDKADHLLSNRDDSLYSGKAIAGWASRYIPSGEEETEIKTNKQVVVRTADNGYTTQIKAGKHHFIADEPESAGGDDYGATPYEYLLAALGACTSITVRMYANRKKWDLQEIKVHLEHSKIYAEDCRSCETKEGKIDHIQREVELTGDLDEEQRARLLEISNKCPVHRTLHSEINIETDLTESID